MARKGCVQGVERGREGLDTSFDSSPPFYSITGSVYIFFALSVLMQSCHAIHCSNYPSSSNAIPPLEPNYTRFKHKQAEAKRKAVLRPW